MVRHAQDPPFCRRGFHDAALLSVFGEAGTALHVAPDAAETGRPRGLVRAGPVKGLRARYYAITGERRIVHPAVSLIAGSARAKLFGGRR